MLVSIIHPTGQIRELRLIFSLDDFQQFAARAGRPNICINQDLKLVIIVFAEAFQERSSQRILLTHSEFENIAVTQIGVEQAGSTGIAGQVTEDIPVG